MYTFITHLIYLHLFFCTLMLTWGCLQHVHAHASTLPSALVRETAWRSCRKELKNLLFTTFNVNLQPEKRTNDKGQLIGE